MKKILLIILPLLLIVGCGKKDGVHTTYYDDEKKYKHLETTYKDGKKNGLYIRWESSVGNLYMKHSEGNYKDDKKDGLWTVYTHPHDSITDPYLRFKSRLNELKYVTGSKDMEFRYKDGILNGLRTSWYENGQKYDEGNYKDNKKIGVWTVFKKNGQVKSKVEYFENGRSISYKSPPSSSSSSSLTICDCDGNYGSLTTSQKRECDQMTDKLSRVEIQTLLLLEQCD